MKSFINELNYNSFELYSCKSDSSNPERGPLGTSVQDYNKNHVQEQSITERSERRSRTCFSFSSDQGTNEVKRKEQEDSQYFQLFYALATVDDTDKKNVWLNGLRRELEVKKMILM